MKRLPTLLIAVCIACKPAPEPARSAAAGPQVQAAVVTIRTTVDGKSRDHAIVIAGSRARSTGEHDVWRLFDTRAKTVTLVDDVARTVKTESLPMILARRNAVNDDALPSHFPRAVLARTNERKTLQGVTAEKVTIVSGGYVRELWLAEHPAIPPGLFAMLYASEPPSSPLAPMMRDVDRALLAARGFPLLDRTRVPLGDGELVVERAVVGISRRDVPASVLAIPRGYTTLTPSS